MDNNDIDIRIGEGRTLDVQLTNAPQPILASTDANPPVLYVPRHGFPNGQIVVIDDHMTVYKKPSNANGTHAVTVIDEDHFSVPVTKNGVGTASGTVSIPYDLTGATVAAQIREQPGESAPLVFTYSGELRVNPYTHGKIRLVLSSADTTLAAFASRQNKYVVEEIRVTDSLGVPDVWYSMSVPIVWRVVQ